MLRFIQEPHFPLPRRLRSPSTLSVEGRAFLMVLFRNGGVDFMPTANSSHKTCPHRNWLSCSKVSPLLLVQSRVRLLAEANLVGCAILWKVFLFLPKHTTHSWTALKWGSQFPLDAVDLVLLDLHQCFSQFGESHAHRFWGRLNYDNKSAQALRIAAMVDVAVGDHGSQIWFRASVCIWMRRMQRLCAKSIITCCRRGF